MIALHTMALFALASAILAVTPGPAVLFIVARSVHQGRRAGVVSALGVAAGGLVHVAGAVLGFSALLASSAAAFTAVKWLGAAYLVYLGVRTLRGNGAGGGGPAIEALPLRRLFTQGFVVNVLNPKTALFFLAFLPQFVDAGRGHVPLQMLLLGLLFIVVASSSDMTYAMLAGTLGKRLARFGGGHRGTRYLTGGAYLALGAGAAMSGSGSK